MGRIYSSQGKYLTSAFLYASSQEKLLTRYFVRWWWGRVMGHFHFYGQFYAHFYPLSLLRLMSSFSTLFSFFSSPSLALTCPWLVHDISLFSFCVHYTFSSFLCSRNVRLNVILTLENLISIKMETTGSKKYVEVAALIKRILLVSKKINYFMMQVWRHIFDVQMYLKNQIKTVQKLIFWGPHFITSV